MANREIIVSNEVGLIQEENGDFILSREGGFPYKLRPNSRTYLAIKILDTRCLAQQRRYDCANDVIHKLESRLDKIESSRAYKFFHKLGVI